MNPRSRQMRPRARGPAAAPASAQRVFPTPEAAVDALVEGVARSNRIEVHDGLGPDSSAIAKKMTCFDPDATWKALPPP